MKKFWVFLFVIFAGTNFAFANDLGISQYPDSPREGEEVKLTITSDKYDLNNASTRWSVDGQIVDSGIGRKTLTLKTSTNGTPQIVLVTVEQEGYNSAQAQRVVEANTNFILYEGIDSYVPSFYKGRRLPSKEGMVRTAFFSFKDGDIIGFNNSSQDIYTWKVNGEQKNDLSGTNKIINNINSKITDNVLNLQVIKEDANQNRKLTEINVPLQRTEVLVYKTDEKKMLRQVLGDTEVGKKIYLLVEPFFFSSVSKKDKNLLYTWKVNDVETKILTPWSVVFSGKDRDSVQINLDILNNKKITQENSRGFTFKVE